MPQQVRPWIPSLTSGAAPQTITPGSIVSAERLGGPRFDLNVVAASIPATGGAAAASGTDPVPAARLIYGGTWNGLVGVKGGIPNRTTIYTTLNPGATAGDINTALAACPSGQVVLLSAGTYNLSGGVDVAKDGVTLRGEVDTNGVPTTILNWTAIPGGACITVGIESGWDTSDSTKWTTLDVSSGVSRGSTAITMASAPGISVGQIAWLTAPAGGNVTGDGFSDFFGTPARPFSQCVKILSKSGSDLTFEPPINADYLSGTIRLHWRGTSNTISQSGVENLSLTHSNSASGDYVKVIGTEECWVKNVKTYSVEQDQYHVYVYTSYRTEIRHCDISHMVSLGSSTYCMVVQQSHSLLIEDNYFHDCPNVMPMFGMGGSMFAYNYCSDMPYTGGFLSQIVFFHGSHNHYNLFEGNWLPRVYHDTQPGSRNNVWLRNRILGWDPADGGKTNDAFYAEAGHANMVVAGNVMGKAGLMDRYNNTTGFPQEGIFGIEDAGDDATLLRLKNWNAFDSAIHTGEELAAGQALPNSYMYTSRPAFAKFWPNIDPDLVSQSDDADDLLAAAYRAANSGAEPSWPGGGGALETPRGSEAFGAASVSLNVAPGGVPSREAFGPITVTVVSGLTVAPGSILSSEISGSGRVDLNVAAPGIGSAEVFGTETVTLKFLAAGVPSSEAFGAVTVTVSAGQTVAPGGIPSSEVFGSGRADLNVAPSSVASGERFGAPAAAAAGPQTVTVSSIPSGQVFGAARVARTELQTFGIELTGKIANTASAPTTEAVRSNPVGV